MKALPEELRLQLIEAYRSSAGPDERANAIEALHALHDVGGEAVAEIYRMHFGGRTANIGTNSVRTLVDVNTLPVGAKLYAAPTQSAPLITVEASLRFRLESEQQKSADLLDEVRELKGKLAAQSAQIPTDCNHCKPYRDATGELVLPLCRCKMVAPQPPQGEVK